MTAPGRAYVKEGALLAGKEAELGTGFRLLATGQQCLPVPLTGTLFTEGDPAKLPIARRQRSTRTQERDMTPLAPPSETNSFGAANVGPHEMASKHLT